MYAFLQRAQYFYSKICSNLYRARGRHYRYFLGPRNVEEVVFFLPLVFSFAFNMARIHGDRFSNPGMEGCRHPRSSPVCTHVLSVCTPPATRTCMPKTERVPFTSLVTIPKHRGARHRTNAELIDQ